MVGVNAFLDPRPVNRPDARFTCRFTCRLHLPAKRVMV